jgi:hypothetical protein
MYSILIQKSVLLIGATDRADKRQWEVPMVQIGIAVLILVKTDFHY